MSRLPEPEGNPAMGVHRISIVERRSCIPLHDKVWIWKEDEKSPSTAAKIIALFHQFARTVGTAGEKESIVSVIFDTQVEQEKKSKKRHNYNNVNRYNSGTMGGFNSTGVTPAANLRQKPISSIRNVPMEMVCASNDQVIVALFIAPEYYKNDARATAKDLLIKFTDQYKDALYKLKDFFQSCLRDSEAARNDLSLIPQFVDFELPDFTSHLPQSGPIRDVVSSRVEDSGTIVLTSDESDGNSAYPSPLPNPYSAYSSYSNNAAFQPLHVPATQHGPPRHQHSNSYHHINLSQSHQRSLSGPQSD